MLRPFDNYNLKLMTYISLLSTILFCGIVTAQGQGIKPSEWKFESQRKEIAPKWYIDSIITYRGQPTLAISGDGKELYVSTGRGDAIAVIETDKNALATTIPVGNRAWGIALDPSGSKLYTANGASNDVSVVDVKSRKELRRIKVGDGPWGIAIVGAAK